MLFASDMACTRLSLVAQECRVDTPVFVLFPLSIGSAKQRPVGLIVLAISQLIGNARLPPTPEMIEMDDRACHWVYPILALWGQPHVVVPVYLYSKSKYVCHVSTSVHA